jgi:hypothetical protein
MTLPNRAFALAGTSQGHLDDHTKILTCPSIFGRFSDKGIDWAIFGYNREPLTRHDYPDTQNADENHFGHFRDFQQHARAGTLPAFIFLEPSWDATGNSQHPNYDVAAGEQLIHDVYYTCATAEIGPRHCSSLSMTSTAGATTMSRPPVTPYRPATGPSANLASTSLVLACACRRSWFHP